MSKNTKHKFYKEYIKLLNRRSEINKAQKALGYVELEKPYQYGFNAYLTLREDVARREDAHVYQYLIDNYSYQTFSKDGVFSGKKKKHYWDNTPKFKLISEAEYLKVEPKYVKFFHHERTNNDRRWDGTVRKYYRCYFEPHYLVMKVVKNFITHKKVIDGELEREEQFVRDKIWDLEMIMKPWYEGYVVYAKHYQNKQLRRKDKVNLKKNLSIDYDDEKYHLTTKRETGYWW